VILRAAASVYGAAASWRRRWYAREPARVRRLARPVVSVGNLSVGGSGKTPMVAHLARLLREKGERPVILSRGYARRRPSACVTIVSDGTSVLAGLDTSGDEPLMLAEMLPDVPVLVCADRFLAGRVAEQQLSATVHLLDDGFQHIALARDVDLLLVDDEDLSDEVIPAGRLREPIENASRADALLVPQGAAERTTDVLSASTRFFVRRAIDAPREVTAGALEGIASGARVVAAAGIARPERFFADLAAAGWVLATSLGFPDHRAFTQRDVRRIVEAVKDANASLVLTTQKDAVRLRGCDLSGLRVAAVPLAVTVEPAEPFSDWLMSRIRAGR
jgi:tetraacyldisaccharide 4'-kinase